MKKILALVLAVMMVFSVCAFASAEETYEFDITVWVAEEIKDLTIKQIEDFNANNEFGIKFNATVEPVSESEAATNMIVDVEAGGDIFCFAQDQFARLVQAGALAKLSPEAAEAAGAANTAGVVAAATSGDAMFAFPLTADNGYFMYYDKTVVAEDHIDSMEDIIADCEAANKFFSFEMESSAWYLASFFFATGCESEWTTDEDGEFISVNDTFNSPNGLIAVKGMKKLVDSVSHNSSSSGSAFASGSAVVVTGTWDYNTVLDILGDNMGVADLPCFTVDGVQYHLGSYNGCKLMGIKPQVDEDKAAALELLAEYLTGEQCQLERFEERSWGPANLAAQGSEAVQANPGLVALNAQAPYSIPQGQIHGSWWDIAKVIGDDVKAAEDEAGLQAALDNYTAKIAALFTMTSDEKNAWTVIGTCNLTDGFFYTDYNNETRSNWADDIPMAEENGIWKTTQAYEMEAGTEFKVRQGRSWDNAFPADNFKVEEAGTYYITLDPATGVVELVAE
ncbi:MAG: extracellular solute-binding protein [Clostridia bacterium]|nr:extracellular solute-binding protein [Clostridia bacterium]